MRIATATLSFILPGLILLGGPVHAGTIEVSFDIKPTSCPNPFNPGGDLLTGTFPTAILGTKEIDTANLDPSGLVIVVPEGGGRGGGTEIPPIQVGYEDVAAPVGDNSNCACTTEGPDGRTDLTAHFDHDAIENALGGVSPGDQYVLCIRGTFYDGTPFEGCDCIFIVGPTSIESGTWGQVKATYRR